MANSCLSYKEKDTHSFSNVDDIQTTHLDLDIKVDFGEQIVKGSAALTIINTANSEKLVLDVRDLNIEKIILDDTNEETSFSIGENKPNFGSPLTIDINPQTQKVTIYYSSSPGAEALQWLTKEQTFGGEHPFLFSQCQPILARTWVPCQDTPKIRFTYSARIKTDPGLLALMSAANPTEKSSDGSYNFEMSQPIPAYLLALAVGNIEFQSLGKNCGVYAEPEILKEAAYEFADTEEMIKKAESLYGTYPWERYDILVLPPSFPYGGMENPRLTFATPTILAGDRSLVSLVAHELAHSWSGNLVTNAYWDDFWLNEGFTSYFELRIMEEIYGAEYATMIEQIGYQDLMNTINRVGADNPDTRLAIDLSGRHPDDNAVAFTIPYDKGARFLRTLEVAYGREKFDAFLKNYFSTFAFKTMTSEDFITYLQENLVNKYPLSTAKAVKIYDWIYNTGMPDKYEIPDSPEFHRVDEERIAFINGVSAAELDVTKWTPYHWRHFITSLPANISMIQMADLDQTFGLTHSNNSEIAFAWFKLCIAENYTEAFPAIEEFLNKVGQNKIRKTTL